MNYKLALTFFFILLLNNSIFSQNTYDFLRLDMSARAAALGGSFVSNTDDPNVIFYNPAGLKTLTGSPVSFSFFKYILDINLASITYSTEFENIGRFAAGIKYANYGKFTEADEFGNVLGEYGAGDVAFIVGYSNSLESNFNYGINAKFIYSNIDKYSSTAMAVDLGLNYNIPDQAFSVGLAILNAGGQLSSYSTTKENLPLDFTIGASKRLAHLPLNLSLDFHRLNDAQSNFIAHLKAFSFGAEFTLSKVLRLRLGYDNMRRQELTIGTTAGLAGFNMGIGAVIKGYNFDYGYSSLGEIGAWHRVSLATTF